MEGLRPEDPQRVGRYRLLKRLGTGAMGRVYLGQSPSGRQVAVKIIRAELADNADFRQRFRQEVKAARRVGGIFTAPVVDADPDAPQPWMVTAFVSGPSLAEAVKSRGPLPVDTVLMLAAGLAEGLSSVHAAGLVHRDLKPSNVLLASDGPRIIDFGVAHSSETVGPTRVGGVIGSPGFMSPEQAAGEPVGPPSDIFSLGGVLAYAATGEPPFGDGPPSALLYRVVHGEAAIGNVPPGVRSLVARCLLSDPAARPTTDDLLGELGEAVPAQGWLHWQGTSEEPASPETGAVPGAPSPPSTVPSQAWGRGAAVAEQPAGEMPAPVTSDAGSAPSVPADVVPAGASEQVSHVSGPRSVPPDVAASHTGRATAAPADAPPDGAGLGQTPTGSIGWLFPDHRDASPAATWRSPGRYDHWRRPAGLAAAGVLAAVILGALAFWLLPKLDPNPPAAGPATGQSAGGSSAQPASPARQTRAGPHASPDPTVGPGGYSGPALEEAEAQVVTAFFAAINNHQFSVAWADGGNNLYASTQALEAAWAHVSHVTATVLGVRGHIVLAGIRATSATGTEISLRQAFTVRNGVIVARQDVPATAAARG
jgi:hypothetical protein